MLSFQEVLRIYDTADDFARTVALYREAAAIPAHNELRYAGHHVLQAAARQASGTEEQAVEAELTRAKNHCHRAMYEATEAGITRAIADVHAFQNNYRDVVVSDVLPRYAEIVALAREAQDELSRGRSGRESVEQQTSGYMKLFVRLRDEVRVLYASQDDLNAKVREDLRKEQDANRKFVIQITTRVVLWVLGSMIAAGGLVLSYMALATP